MKDNNKTNEHLNEKLQSLQKELDAVKESAFHYKTIADFAYDWDLWINPDETLKYVSLSCERITGYTPEEFMNKSSLMTDIIVQEDMPLWDVHFHDSRREMQKQEVQFRIMRKDGELRWIEHICHPVHTKQGKFLGFRASNRDITRRKIVEEAFRKSERNLSEAQRIAHLGSWDWDIVTNELYWSDEVYRIFGLMPRRFDATYEAFLESVHPEDREAVKKAFNNSLADPEAKYSIEHRIVRPDGLERIVHERAEVTFNNDGKPVHMYGIVHDITEIKKTEDALKKALSEIRLLKDQLEAENIYLREEIKNEQHYRDIIGDSDSIKYVLLKVEQVAQTDATVLILGETGTGKALVARAIHNASPRSERPFVIVNCAALPANLIESELFGREKGAFTGAQARQIGRFELANEGTIFLDEIGEMPLELQTKLLRVLQDGEFERLGSPHTIKVNVRVIASTNRNLKEEAENGRFRQDLFYRLNVFPITLPPLRKRKEDIPVLVNYFVEKYSKKMGKTINTVSKATMQMLQEYSWPGNVRELENIIERAVIISQGTALQVADKLEAPHAVDPIGTSKKSLKDMEKGHILQVLEQTRWRIEGEDGAAAILGLNPSTLRGRMRKLGIKHI
jgi:PAS domain S-box-containing protein